MITEADAREIALEIIGEGGIGYHPWQYAEEDNIEILSCKLTGNSRWTVKLQGWLPEYDLTGWITLYIAKDGGLTGYKYSFQTAGYPVVEWVDPFSEIAPVD